MEAIIANSGDRKVLFEITSTYTFEEHALFNKAVQKNNKKFKFLTLFCPIAFFIIGILNFLLQSWTFGILSLVLAFGYPLLIYLFSRRAVRETFKKNSIYSNSMITVQFSEAGIEQATDISQIFIEYAKIRKLIETDTHLYLMLDDLQGIIVRKKDITAEQEAFIRRKCGH